MATTNDPNIQKLQDMTRAQLIKYTEGLLRNYNDEIEEFNMGYVAAEQGKDIDAQPSGTRFDIWRVGWAWGKYCATEQQSAQAGQHE